MARIAVTLGLVLLACSAAGAAESPTDALRQIFVQANQILTDPETDDRPLERLLAVRRLVNEAFDFRSAAELASGDHWRARTAAEQEEFTWLFADLLERGFVWRMASRARLERGTKVRYVSELLDGDAALVQTAMARRDGGELLLDYYLVDREGAWKVRDVAIDGVSLMANYRAQLDRVLGTASFSEVLSQMRAKVGTAEPRATAVVSVGSPTMIASAEAAEPAPDTASTPEPSETAPVTVDAAEPTDSSPMIADATEPADEMPVPVEVVTIVDVPVPAPELRLAVFDPAIDTPPALTIVHAAVESPQPRARITKAYWLQILTAGTADEAGRLVSRLRDANLSIGVERTMFRGRLFVHVRVGPFQDAEEAVLSLLDLQTKGHNPYLVAELE